MTLSNKITISRIILIPIMILMLYIPPLRSIETVLNLDLGELLFGSIFIIASFTDFLDGYLARKRQEITSFGKFLDPIADKLLTISAILYIVFERTEHSWWWILIIVVLFREFIVSALRMMAAKSTVIAASYFGKLKTVVTMIAVILILFNGFGLYHLMGNSAYYVTDAIFYLAILLTALSGIDYVIKNRNVILESI